MVSNVNVEIIQRDIGAINEKIARCNRTKEELLAAIEKEKDTIVELKFYIREEDRNKTDKHKFDTSSLKSNVIRCEHNIETFKEVASKEDATIERFKHMIEVLTRDLARPTEITFDAATGQLITK